ncbi:hypothetical protein GCM10010218_41330 [Streptomyces mashuensis]|uniref:DUF4034 domain-containing protein n=1 Tax=Streptomyces mashuensis TaxID=33904 RepID=A0A919EED3_9ACTN|nr:hypothetical protein [Streptomyces mashuensis]GHF55533.1 hypothetical protein GCM10010218_41330 [Streptomyces mashuensis]
MALFRRRPSTVQLDPDHGDPAAAALRAATRAGDWRAMNHQLAAVPQGEYSDGLVIGAVMETNGVEQWIPQVVAAEPQSALAHLVSGARHIGWAWQARGGGYASDVSREQFQVFFERLRVAEDALYRTAELRPDWSAPWYLLQMSGRGLQVGQEIQRRRFEATVRRCPGHMGAHQQQLQQLCKKWGGSHQEAHAFARSAMLAAPLGSPFGKLVASAHIEEALSGEGRDLTAHLSRPEVLAQLHEAADRSFRHPHFAHHITPGGWIPVYNTFAMAFSLAGDVTAARHCFTALGDHATEWPWQYLNGGDPAKAFTTWRAKAGL